MKQSDHQPSRFQKFIYWYYGIDGVIKGYQKSYRKVLDENAKLYDELQSLKNDNYMISRKRLNEMEKNGATTINIPVWKELKVL